MIEDVENVKRKYWFGLDDKLPSDIIHVTPLS